MKKLIALGFFIGFYFSINTLATAIEIKTVHNSEITYILNHFEILATKDDISSPYIVRVIRSWEEGECTSASKSCPKSTLYLAVSTFDLSPEFNLYQIKGAYGWRFVKWKNFPSNDGQDKFIVLEMEAKELNKNNKLWEKKSMDISINPWKLNILRKKGMLPFK